MLISARGTGIVKSVAGGINETLGLLIVGGVQGVMGQKVLEYAVPERKFFRGICKFLITAYKGSRRVK